MASISEAFAIALEHHQGGRLSAAEQIYRQILAVDPQHVDALHLLGVDRLPGGPNSRRRRTHGESGSLEGNEVSIHSNLGSAYKGLGRFEEAIACYNRAIELHPDNRRVSQLTSVRAADHGKIGRSDCLLPARPLGLKARLCHCL